MLAGASGGAKAESNANADDLDFDMDDAIVRKKDVHAVHSRAPGRGTGLGKPAGGVTAMAPVPGSGSKLPSPGTEIDLKVTSFKP